MSGALSGINVIDTSTGIPGAYLGRLLCDLGADVSRTMSPNGDNPLFPHLHHGTQLLKAPLNSNLGESLLDSTDAIVMDDATSADVGVLRAQYPDLVVTTFSPWGLRGEWSDRPSSDLVVQAESGVIGHHGRHDEPPYKTGGRLIDWCAGACATAATLGAIRHAKRFGTGEHVDVSLQATAVMASIAFVDVRYQLEGFPQIQGPARIIDAPSIEPTADGFVAFATNTRAQIVSFLEMIGRLDLVESDWERSDYRIAHLDEWNAIVHPWTAGHPTAEIIRQSVERRIPVGPVLDGQSLVQFDQARIRGLYVLSANGAFIRPQSPFVIDGVRLGCEQNLETSIDPTLDSREVGIEYNQNHPERRPLDDIRVLDATTFFAGPVGGQLLAYLGADVIHLESCQQLDGARGVTGVLAARDTAWERSGMWHSCNCDKRSLTLELSTEAGRNIASQLVGACDVMLENFAPRVFERFKLAHEDVRALRGDIVHVRMPAYGLSGPWRDRPGFAQTMEAASGLAWRTGPIGQGPRIPRGPGDPLTGWHSAVVAIAGLLQRDRIGRGVAAEVAMFDVAASVSAELVIQRSLSGIDLGREGNRSDEAGPEGIYSCQGSDQWLAVSVKSESQWLTFCRLLDRQDWLEDPALQSIDLRRGAADRLDEGIGDWAARGKVGELVELLVAEGIPAGRVRDPRLMFQHPQLLAFGYYEVVEHPVVGSLNVPTLPFRFASIRRWSRKRAPLLGEHNRDILVRDLGLAEVEFDRLHESGVIGTEPQVKSK